MISIPFFKPSTTFVGLDLSFTKLAWESSVPIAPTKSSDFLRATSTFVFSSFNIASLVSASAIFSLVVFFSSAISFLAVSSVSLTFLSAANMVSLTVFSASAFWSASFLSAALSETL